MAEDEESNRKSEEGSSSSDDELSSSNEQQLPVARSKRAITNNVTNYYPKENDRDYYWDDEIGNKNDDDQEEDEEGEESSDDLDDDYVVKEKKERDRLFSEEDEDSDENQDFDDDWSEASEEEESEDGNDFEDEEDFQLKSRKKQKREVPLSDYEQLRQKNVERNNERLKSLGLLGEPKTDDERKSIKNQRKKERSANEDPERKSSRSTHRISYVEEEIPEASDIEALYPSENDEEEEKPNQKPVKKKFEDFQPSIGMRIQKEFDGTLYFGKVISGPRTVHLDENSRETSLEWGVLYDDGDEEDMDRREIYDCSKPSN